MAESPPSPDIRRRLVVGLGNPGPDYVGSRHNVGFEVLERMAQVHGLRLRRQERMRGLGPVRAKIAEYWPQNAGGTRHDDVVYLVEPWTYMNLSGQAIAAYARFFGIAPDSIFVIYDDLHLPLGRIRIRPGGSPGGHNGIKSLQACLGSEGFPRLRMGIGATGMSPSDMVDPDFVLSRFGVEETALLGRVLEAGVEAALSWLRGRDLGDLMNLWNGWTATGDEGDGSS